MKNKVRVDIALTFNIEMERIDPEWQYMAKCPICPKRLFGCCRPHLEEEVLNHLEGHSYKS